MENRGLLFIPDISGFTQFVNKVDIEHGRLIIQELLEILVSANQIGLTISEIEGDAILFYKYGDSPGMDTLYRQVEKMFCEFHRNIMAYDMSRYCQCTACSSAINLSLKVITHYGEFTDYKVADFKKLIGRDVIVAHQLLKNDIDQHEYWLVTRDLLNLTSAKDLEGHMHWRESIKRTDTGDIPFQYAPLTDLKMKIGPEPSPEFDIPGKKKMFSVTREYDTDIITLFRAAGLHDFRHRWFDGVREVKEVSHFLPRIGMQCRYVTDDGEQVVFSSGYSFHPEKIFFAETDENKTSATHYLLEKIDDLKTRLTIEYFMKKEPVKNLLFTFGKKNKLEASYKRSMENLAELIIVIEFPY